MIIPALKDQKILTDLNKSYLKERLLKIEMLGRGHAWFDTGTFESFYEASNFVRSVENRQGLMISNIHEIAYRLNFISTEDLQKFVDKCGKNMYRDYLEKITKEGL